MEKIDLEGFFIKNKFIFIGVLVAIVLITGSVFGARYYRYKLNKNSNKTLWRGIRLYISYNGKNPETLEKSVSYLNKLAGKYRGTDNFKISNFYLGLDYFKMGKLNKAKSYLKKYTGFYPKPGSNNLTYLALSNLATIAVYQKKYPEAISYFDEMSKIYSVKLQEYALLEEAALYTKIKEPKKAVAIYNTMLTNDAMTGDRGYIQDLIQLNS